MISETTYHLTCVGEECLEVAQRVSKAIRFGLFEVQPGQELNNWQRIAQEFDDLQGALRTLTEKEGLLYIAEPSAIRAKQDKIAAYLEHAKKVGQVK